MEKMTKILSGLMLALICCVSVFQYHHHDDAGHAFFLIESDSDITMIGSHECCQGHDCERTHSDETSVCGMHLADALTSGKAQLTIDNVVLFVCEIVDCVVNLSEPETDVENQYAGICKIGELTEKYSYAQTTRGSPACV